MKTVIFLIDCEYFKKDQEATFSINVANGLINEGFAIEKDLKEKAKK